MKKINTLTMKGDRMGIHNCSSVFLKCEAQAFVEVLTDGGVRLSGAWDDRVGFFVMNTLPFREGHNGKDIIVPFYDVVMAVIGILWEVGGGGSFDLSSVDLFSKGVVCNSCTGGRFGLERGYCGSEGGDE